MAFARRVLRKIPQFDVKLGPGALGFHDEALFSLQLQEAGHSASMVLDVCVEHHSDASRVCRKNPLNAAIRIGRGDAYVGYHRYHYINTWTVAHSMRLHLGLLVRRLLFWQQCLLHQQVQEWKLIRARDIAAIQQYTLKSKNQETTNSMGYRKQISVKSS